MGTGAGIGVRHTSGNPIDIPIICEFANIVVLLFFRGKRSVFVSG